MANFFVVSGVTQTGGNEYRETVVSSALGSGFVDGQFGNVGTLALSSGDWDIFGQVNIVDLGSLGSAQVALSENSGNTTTDHVVGDNQLDIPLLAAANEGSASVRWRLNLSAATTVYLKTKLVGAVGNVVTGKVCARKMG